MGYITQEDLLRADGNLVWNMAINRETNELDEDKIRQAISDAEAEIDSFLSRRYQLPLGVTEIPRPLQRVAVSLAFYWLSERDNQITELIQKRYDDAIKTLREMANGTRDLGLPTYATPAENVRVRKPDGAHLSPEGERLDVCAYWLRREAEGDVEITALPKNSNKTRGKK
ncbi:DUF1320 domain-containing protein [Escherichia coli]|nr:DUF1320 domain-containing protein [Escherichia coli]